MSDRETTAKLRGMIRRVTVKNIKDDGEAQTASIEVADGIWREGIEVLQQHGISSHAKENGGLAIALALGGDEGDIVLLPIANPSSRLGGLSAGDSAIFNDAGDRVHVKADGGIEIVAASSITLRVQGVSVTINSEGLIIRGGKVKHDDVDIGKTHKHGGVVRGSVQTDTPSE